MISCSRLTKSFGSRVAVNQVSFDVERGEIAAILGPNGAGKSTLVKMLSGLLQPDSGSLSVAGYDPREHPRNMRRIIGVTPENLGLLPELTIEEHLAMSGPIYGLDASATRERSVQLLRVLGIYATRRTYAKDCSHGMRKKTALALALLHNPAVVILDEPFEGIDPVSADTICVLLKTMSHRGITVLLTSHMLSMVNRLADRLMLIRAGSIAWNSRMNELSTDVEGLYFELVESSKPEDLAWLRSQPS